jgi:hypothetical protein
MLYTVHMNFDTDRGYCVTEKVEAPDKETARELVKTLVLTKHPDAVIGKSNVRKSSRK